MKNQILIAMVLLGTGDTLLAFEGSINFANRVANIISAPIYGVNPLNPLEQKSGNPSAVELGFPAGTTVYEGAKLSGTGFSAQLWVGTSLDSLVACTASGNSAPLTSTFRTGSGAGLINTSTAITPGIEAGTPVFAVLRVWDNQGGAITSWQQVLGDCAVARGESGPLSLIPGGINDAGHIFTNPNLIGLTSFQLYLCPEPSVVALGLLGAGVLMFRRRK